MHNVLVGVALAVTNLGIHVIASNDIHATDCLAIRTVSEILEHYRFVFLMERQAYIVGVEQCPLLVLRRGDGTIIIRLDRLIILADLGDPDLKHNSVREEDVE